MLGFSLGVLAGMVIATISTLIVARRLKVGTLRIDRSDPEDHPYMFLEISKGVGDISEFKYVILDISNKNYISHE